MSDDRGGKKGREWFLGLDVQLFLCKGNADGEWDRRGLDRGTGVGREVEGIEKARRELGRGRPSWGLWKLGEFCGMLNSGRHSGALGEPLRR